MWPVRMEIERIEFIGLGITFSVELLSLQKLYSVGSLVICYDRAMPLISSGQSFVLKSWRQLKPIHSSLEQAFTLIQVMSFLPFRQISV